MAKKGGALPAFEELELIRTEGALSVRRFLARLGIPRSSWYYWRFHALHGRSVRRWPAPVVDALAPRAAETAHRYAAWGHRKIWAMLRADGVRVSVSSVERALRRQALLQPRRYLAERRQLAAHRKRVFLAPPTRRNRVWQADFTEFETARGGTWRILVVVDYATKVCLAAAVTGTSAARDAIESLQLAITEGERLIGHDLLIECTATTEELVPLVIVTDNGPAFKSADFVHFIARHPELRHVRTRHHALETNGVVERFNRSLKYEHLYREEIADVIALQDQVDAYRELYNWVRPHEALGQVAPMVRYLAEPLEPAQESHLSEGDLSKKVDAEQYGYDKLSRLTAVAGPDGPATYRYDPVGNRTSKVAGTTTTYTYDRVDRMTAAGSMGVTVDANGNMTARGTDTFGYDQANRLSNATVGGAGESYVYDAAAIRFSRQLGGNPAIRYVSDINRSLPVTIDDGTRKYVWGLGLAYAVNGTSLEIYHADRLGSDRVITDVSGNTTASYRSDAWGVPTATFGSSGQPFRFAGEPLDATGLSYLRARNFDSDLGRFMSRDRLAGNPTSCQTLNRYSYAANDPVTLIDPSGMKSQAARDDPLYVAAKCANAAAQVALEGTAIYSAVTFGTAFFGGGALVPGVNLVLGGLFLWNSYVAVNNAEWTRESVAYCFGLQKTLPGAFSINAPAIPVPPIFPGPGGLPIPVP